MTGRAKADKGGAESAAVIDGLELILSPPDSQFQKFAGVFEVQFLADSEAVRLDGFHVDAQLVGDFAGIESLPGQFEDLEFTIGKLIEDTILFGLRVGRESSENRGSGSFVEVNSAT